MTNKDILEEELLSALGSNRVCPPDKIKEFSKNSPVVEGKVISVDADHAYIDIADTGLVGVLSRKYYRDDFTRDLTKYLSVGQLIQAKVLRCDKKEGRNEFILYTAYYIASPWDTLKSRNLEEGQSIVVKCIALPTEKNKTFFWSEYALVPGLEVMCDTTQKFNSKTLQVGSCYRCKIVTINYTEKRFKVVPYEKVDGQGNFKKKKAYINISKEKITR